MISRKFLSCLPACAIVGFALATDPLHATATFLNGYTGTATEVNSSTELAYQADASSSDLINNLAPTAGSFTTGNSTAAGIWRTDNSASITKLNDGIHGVSFTQTSPNSVQGAWPTRLATSTYTLGPGANNQGFDITSIQSIAAWNGAGFGNQAWTLAVQTAGSASFVDVVTVNYQPLAASAPGATKVTLSNLNITGIQALKVTTISVNGGANGGAFVWRELDAIGVPTNDATPPIITTLAPAKDATGVAVGANLVATFNKAIELGTGNITIRNLDTLAEAVITLPDARVSRSGSVLTINPYPDLTGGTRYAVRIDASAIDDLAGNSFLGITDDTTWTFTTSTAGLVAKVFLLGGQSNMVGQAPSSGLPSVPVNLQQPQDDVLFYYSGNPSLTTLRPGSGGNPSPSGAHFGPEVTFGRTVANASPSVRYAIIKHGENGTALYNDWAPGTGASYTAFRNTVAAGLAALQAAGYTTEIVGMLWQQGESDAIEGQQASYGNNLTAFIADIRSRYGANLPFLIGEIRRSNGTAFVTVADTQIAVAAAVPHAAFVPASDLTFSDTYHFDATSQVTLGERFAASYAALTADTTPPTLDTLSPTDNATNVPLTSNLVATFGEAVALGSGSITIKNLDTPSQTLITLPDARVSVSGAVLTINPSTNFSPDTHYAVQIGASAITDLSGNPFTGITNDATWNFVTAAAPLRIMCLGDSITAGYTDNPDWANHPFKFGYRSGLYTLLTNAGYNFVFVGGSAEPWNLAYGDPSHGGTYKPTLDLRDLGQDGHRGYGGAKASTLQGNLASWLTSDNPNLILLMIGTNGLSQSGVNTLVNTITTNKPDVPLIIAQIIPLYTFNQGTVDYNTYIRNTLVPNYQALGKKITLVDQYSSFLTDPANLTSIDQSLFANGINHPSNPGYDKMAQVWFEGIEALGLGPNSFAKWISDYPAVGDQTGLHQDPDGDGNDNGVENFFGTNPGAFSQGLVSGAVNSGAGTFTFTHPINNTPASDISATYFWSKNLTTFTAAGNSFEGTTVTFSQGTPAGGFVTVTATVTGSALEKLFVDVRVRQK